jgi:GMP synthase (glutamine-hydrolysing)
MVNTKHDYGGGLSQGEPETVETLLPFPFGHQTFCRYEPVGKRIEEIRVLVVDNLLRTDQDLSEVAKNEWGNMIAAQLRRERLIAGMAIENILNNINRLVQRPATQIAHVSDLSYSIEEFKPDAIILTGTLCDFDFYNPEILASFARFVRSTKTPLLGISGGHQLVGLSFGARVITLNKFEQHEQRKNRPIEYQYRFIRITEPGDPIFQNIAGIDPSGQSKNAHILRVWQNHGLQLDRVPEGFKLLATAYLCRNQMMVKRSEGQLIYTVQFHLEKSFEDWNKSRTRWEHPNESRDGRIVFENFLLEAIEHVQLANEANQSQLAPWIVESSLSRKDFTQNDALTSAETVEAYAVARIKDSENEPFYVNGAFVLQVCIQDENPEGLEITSKSPHPKADFIEFDVVVYAQDIKLEPSWTLPYVFRRTEEIQFVEFQLTPIEPGRKVISVEFLYQCHWLAVINLEIDVVEAQDLDVGHVTNRR